MVTRRSEKIYIGFILLLISFAFAATAYAHGVDCHLHGSKRQWHRFSLSGESLIPGSRYGRSPSDRLRPHMTRLNPWLVGTADGDGHYAFVLDPALLGTWDIQYRKAGHGDIIHIPLEAGMIEATLVSQPTG